MSPACELLPAVPVLTVTELPAFRACASVKVPRVEESPVVVKSGPPVMLMLDVSSVMKMSFGSSSQVPARTPARQVASAGASCGSTPAVLAALACAP